MNIQVNQEIQEEIDEYGVQYGVYATTCTPYCGDRYVETRKDEPELLMAESIPALYEYMAKVRINHTLHGEKELNSPHCRMHKNLIQDYKIEFTDIFVIVERFSNSVLEQTTTYKNIGKARDEAIAKRIADEKKEAERIAIWRKEESERRDKAEFERLSKIYGSN